MMFGLNDLHPEKSLHETAAGYVEVCGVFFHEFVTERVRCCDVHHIINEKTMDDKIVATAFHEDCFLTLDGMVSIAFHPIGNVQVPLACCLLSSIDTFNELQAMAFRNGFGHQSEGRM